jgi:hypothetical protein
VTSFPPYPIQRTRSRPWIRNGPTLADIHLAQGHLDEQIEVEEELGEQEREAAILDATSLTLEITAFKKELLAFSKKKKTDLLYNYVAAKVEITRAEKETCKYS